MPDIYEFDHGSRLKVPVHALDTREK